VLTGQCEHLRADEALDQPEDVSVGAALDLAQRAPLSLCEESDLVDHRQPVGQELLREVKLTAADHVGVDVPADPLGRFDAACVARGFGGCRGRAAVRWMRVDSEHGGLHVYLRGFPGVEDAVVVPGELHSRRRR